MRPPEQAKLQQTSFLKGVQKFEILPDGDLLVSLKRMTTRREFRIPLWMILSKPERLKFQQFGTLVGAIVFWILALPVVIGMFSAPDLPVLFILMFPLLFFSVLGAVCFWKFKVLSVDAIAFNTRDGEQIHVWADLPSTQECHEFCDLLAKLSEEAWNSRPHDPTQQSLAGEISALKKLLDSGILTADEFETAKARLISGTGERRIGFGA